MSKEKRVYLSNRAKQLEIGEGDDCIQVTEPHLLLDREKLLRYRNVYEYDYARWVYQHNDKISRGVDVMSDPERAQHTLYLPGDWFRWIDEGRLIYGCLVSLENFFLDRAWEIAGEIREASGHSELYLLDSFDYPAFTRLCIERYGVQGQVFYFVQEDQAWSNFHIIVFVDAESARRISFAHFLKSVKQIEASPQALNQMMDDFEKSISAWIRQNLGSCNIRARIERQPG